MQDSRVIVPLMGQDIPQRVVSEPVSVPWVAIRKAVNATAYRHDLRIRLACEKHRLARIGFIRSLDGSAVRISYRLRPVRPGFQDLVRRAGHLA